MGAQRIAVAVNPSAGFGQGADVGSRTVGALRLAGHTVEMLQEVDYPSLVARVADVIASRPDALVVVGGDGMVSLGVNALAGSAHPASAREPTPLQTTAPDTRPPENSAPTTGIPLGIVPAGTGNDMALSLGIPLSDTDAAIRRLIDGLERAARAIDLGQIVRADGSDIRFACTLSAGFDAIVNERANQMRWPRGRMRYNLAMLIELARLRPIRYRLELDDVRSQVDALLVCVGNGVSIGGGMRATPNALLDDGLLDVLVVEPLTRLQFLRLFPRVFSGTHLSDRRVTVQRVRTLRIEADAVAYADGERVGPLPIDITVLPGALLVLA